MQSIRQEVHRILTSTIPNNILEHLPLVLWFLTYLLTNVYPHLFRVCALRFPLIVEMSEEQSSSSSSSSEETRASRVAASYSALDTHASNLHGKLYKTVVYISSLPTSWLNGLASSLRSYALNLLQLQLPLRVFSGANDRGATYSGNESHSLWRYLGAALFTSGASVFVHANSVSLINTLIDYINANYNLINHEVPIMRQYVNRRRLIVEYLCAFVSNVMTNIIIQCVHTGVDVNGKFWRHIPSASEWQSTRQLGKGNLFSRLYANISLTLYFIYVEILMLRNPWMSWFFRIRAPSNNDMNSTSHSNNVHVNNRSHSSTAHASSTFTPEANTGHNETVNTRSSLENKFMVSSTDLVYVSGNDVFNCALAGFRLAYRGEPSHLLSMLYLHLNNSTQLSVYHLLNRWYRGKYKWSPVTELPNVEANRVNTGHAATPVTTTTSTATATASSTNLGNNVLSPQYDNDNGARSSFTLHHINDMLSSVGRSLRELLSTASEMFTYGNAVTDINNAQNNRSSFPQSSSVPSQQTQQESRNSQQDATVVMNEPNLHEYVLLSASSFSLINFNWWHFSSGILVGLALRKLTEYWSDNREHYPELQKVVDWLFPSPVRIPELLLRNASASDGVCRIYSDDPEVISILHHTHNSNNHNNHVIDNSAIEDNNNGNNTHIEDNNINDNNNNGNSAPLPSSSTSLPLQRYLLAPLQRLRTVMSSSYDTSVPNIPSPTQVNNDQTHHTNNHFVVAEIPISADCFCPISLTVMTDPVSTVDGFTYERSAIEQWFTQQQTSPMTNLRLANLTLTTNMEVRSKVIAAAQQCNHVLRELSRAL